MTSICLLESFSGVLPFLLECKILISVLFQEKNVSRDMIEGKIGKIYIPNQEVRDCS